MTYFSKKFFAAIQTFPKRGSVLGRAAFVMSFILAASIPAHATNWYVDNSLSSGSDNGTSWANAWKSISAISWGSVKPGDTVYISGGSSSQVYSEFLNSSGVSGTAASPITISAGQDAGHTGQVIIDGSSSGQTVGVQLGAYQQLTGNVAGSTNFVVRNFIDSSDISTGIAIYGSGSGISINYIQIYSCNNGITISSSTGTVISNCYLYDIRGDHGIELYESTGGYDASLVHNCTVQINASMIGDGIGSWGIAGWGGFSVYNCNIYSALGSVYATEATKHEDGVVFYDSYCKIYNNTITDMGNAAVEGGCLGATAGYYMIYNNVMQLMAMTPNVERGVEWSPNSSVTALTNIYICNNTFVNLAYNSINWGWTCSACVNYYPTPTVNDFFVYNNIFYNSVAPYIYTNADITSSDFTFDYNAIWAGSSGTTNFYDCGSSPSQPHSKIGNVQFVTYDGYSASNNYHLRSTDTVAKGNGLNLSSLFTTDKDGNTRSSTGAWDIGAYAYTNSVVSTNPAIAVTPASQNFGTIAMGTTASNTFTVQNAGGGTLTGSASVASPFSIASGGTYSLTNGQSQVVTVLYSPSAAGTNTQNVSFTGGGGAAVSVTGAAVAPLSGLTFPASVGAITSPFVLTNGYIYQPVQTLISNVGVANCGTATYVFSITNAGNYIVECLVQATNEGMDSFYVNIDSTPTDPYMVWKILPLTTGFQEETVTWQGTGTYDAPEFSPQIFNLASGTHQLIIVGREPYTELEQISIVSYSSTSPVITVTPTNQSFGTIATGTSATATFTVQNTGGGTLAGSAGVASPFSILSGGSYSLTNGQSQVVTVQYSPTVAGTNTQNVTFTGGAGVTVSVTGSATAALSGLTFAATSGTITSPFVATNGYIYQPIQTGATNGGTATYTFTITNAGSYVVQALVNAPSDSENSFYVNIDAMPTDPYMTWQIPITTGFQNLLVSWQGNGTYTNSEFVPEIFSLTAGTHQLIFVGREMDTQLQSISILKIPSPPTGLHVVPGS